MKTVRYDNRKIKCYQDADLATPKFVRTCEMAKALWERRCKEYVAEHGHEGSCVIGAGFTVWYLPPRGRKPRPKMILDSPSGSQGSNTWEASTDEIAQVFKDAGIKAAYAWGRMD
jgi:hypothetical protein